MKKNIYVITLLFSISIITCLLSSCGNTKKLAYFNNIQHDSVAEIQKQNLETVISKNDILQINISTLDDVTNRQLNAPNAGASGGATNGYLVDESGVVKLPFIGTVKAEGSTKKQLSERITDELLTRKLAKEPIVTVRIENYKVTVLGEVNHPGNIPVPNEKMTLPEALAAAGDLTAYGKRDDILLIREVGNKRIYKHIDLNKGQIFDSDIYNLQNQDLIYVSPTPNKAASIDRSPQLLSLVLSGLSIIIIIYTQFIK
jgi:polysaccharide export outer membrane protein